MIKRVRARPKFREHVRGTAGQPLTEREIEVMWNVADGMSNKLIGAKLDIAAYTVKFHVANACAKLGVATRTQAAVKFVLARVDAAGMHLSPRTLPSHRADA